MPSQNATDETPITCTRDILDWMSLGFKGAGKQLLGVEHEKQVCDAVTGQTVPFANPMYGPSIRTLLLDLAACGPDRWEIGRDNANPVALIGKGANKNVSITLEPGGQFEHSDKPLPDVHAIARSTLCFMREATGVAARRKIRLVACGYNASSHDRPLTLMPKARYERLFGWLREAGHASGDDAMRRTATMQLNLDYADEAQMVKMMRVGLALQPIMVALCANSPFLDDRPSGCQSYRSRLIHNAMGGRYGFMLPVAFEDGFGIERFAEWALDLPMLGLVRDGVFSDVKGATFRTFMNGSLDAAPGERPVIADWQNHLKMIWPEMRMNGHILEARGADVGPPEMMMAMSAFWAGLMYDGTALDTAYLRIRDWGEEDREYLRENTPVHGLQTPFLGTTAQEIALEMLDIAERGLKNRHILDGNGHDERIHLAPFRKIAAEGRNWAQIALEAYHGPWQGDIRRYYEMMDYAANEGAGPSILASTPTILETRKAQLRMSDVRSRMCV